MTLLHILAEERNPDGIQRALHRAEYRKQINDLDAHGRNAVLVAAASGHDRCVDLLLRAGAALLPLTTSGYAPDVQDRALATARRVPHRRGHLAAIAWSLELRQPAPPPWLHPPTWTAYDALWIRRYHALLPGDHLAQLAILAWIADLPDPAAA